jgi:hypothetical protein
MLLVMMFLSCERELDVADFRDDFGNYQPELKVEGLLDHDTPNDSIVRIIRTEAVTESDVFDGIDDDGDGEIDEYDETLPLIQDTTATVTVTNLNSGEEYEFQYVTVAEELFYREFYEDAERVGERRVFGDGGYKPKSDRFQVELYAQYRLEIYSKAFDQTITGVTTVYPPVEFINIDTLSIIDDDRITLKSDEENAIYWRSDFDVTSYFVTVATVVELLGRSLENEQFVESVSSYSSSRDKDLTEKHGVSIGIENFFVNREANAGKILSITVEALSPEYGRYIFSALPLNDAQRSNLRDQDGKPVMGAFGATAAKTVVVEIEE